MASSAADVQAASRVDVPLSRGLVVAIEARDVQMLFLDGIIKLPLLQALYRVLAQETVLDHGREAIGQLSQEDMQLTVETLREFACAVVVEPVFVMDPDGDPVHADVRMLSMADLLAIWRRGREVLGLKEVEAAISERFRRASRPTTGAAVPAGQDVRPAAERVAAAGRP